MMITEILNISTDFDSSIEKALSWLRAGMPVVFPTETVYGIGGGLFDLNAVEMVYKIKGRDFKNPLSAHISNINDAKMLCRDIPDEFYILADKFLPGPLSIVMSKRSEVPDLVTGGGDTLSIRFPANDIFLELSQKFGQPIAATSANKSGKPSPVIAMHAYDDLQGLVPVILDAGKCRYQIESTVISLVDEPKLIRPGAISQKVISEALGREIKSLNTQIAVFDNKKSSLENSSFRIICFDNFDSIIDFCKDKSKNDILIFSRENIHDIFSVQKTEESSFFSDLRDAEINGVQYLLVEKDQYVMNSEVLRHRLKIK
ncbi:MAG: threonylcarbamoyl-AMP synthase [Candidatus Kapabacteria bacterium]|nr:threonylcarbamoyl-AMP synthase [Candidatus Kapabacteria bacterium]